MHNKGLHKLFKENYIKKIKIPDKMMRNFSYLQFIY